MKKRDALYNLARAKERDHTEKKALAVYVHNATLDLKEKKHIWANEETFDRLNLERDARPKWLGARLWKASWNERERRNRGPPQDREARYLQS